MVMSIIKFDDFTNSSKQNLLHFVKLNRDKPTLIFLKEIVVKHAQLDFKNATYCKYGSVSNITVGKSENIQK
ncbi:hypothetical protein BV372_31580 [Nostoc sp. T09]|nr:hypothetical protein BV372_31580 [Nostoc sp. T09]